MFANLILASTIVLAAPSEPSTPELVEFPLHRANKKSKDLLKEPQFEGNFVDARLENFQYYYQITLGVGTPAQEIDFTIDTGSSDLWVMSGSNPWCTTDSENTTGINCTGSVFNYEKSTTFHRLSTPFEIGYGDHTFANGSLASDSIAIGNSKSTILNATFGLAAVGNSSTCVFGIGFIGDEGEAHVHRNGSGVYPTYFNIPTLMKQQGLILTNAYSLWLNDADAQAGSILFGGVDSSKYTGPLTVMPIFNNYAEFTDHPIQMRVMFNSVAADNATLAEFNIAVLLDSGTSFSYLPPKLFDAFGSSLGFVYDDALGYYVGSIEAALENVKEFRLDFSGAKINVPTTDLLVGLTMDDNVTPFTVNGKPQAILAMGGVDDDYSYILGDVFLRSMYAVFDLDHYEIALAQARKNATANPVLSVIEASIPGAFQASRYASTSANNSSFSIYPFTPAVAAPSNISISIAKSVPLSKSETQTSLGAPSATKGHTETLLTSSTVPSFKLSEFVSTQAAPTADTQSDDSDGDWSVVQPTVTSTAAYTTDDSTNDSTVTLYWGHRWAKNAGPNCIG